MIEKYHLHFPKPTVRTCQEAFPKSTVVSQPAVNGRYNLPRVIRGSTDVQTIRVFKSPQSYGTGDMDRLVWDLERKVNLGVFRNGV